MKKTMIVVIMCVFAFGFIHVVNAQQDEVEDGQKGATVEKMAKGTKPVLKRKVQFHSYDQDTDTVTVIQEEKLVRYPTKNLDSKRPYVLKWEKNRPVTITSTYDPKLGKDVVIDAATAPLEEPKSDTDSTKEAR